MGNLTPNRRDTLMGLRRPQIRLRGLMIVVGIVGLVMAWYVHARDVLKAELGMPTFFMECLCLSLFGLMYRLNYLHDTIFKRRE